MLRNLSLVISKGALFFAFVGMLFIASCSDDEGTIIEADDFSAVVPENSSSGQFIGKLTATTNGPDISYLLSTQSADSAIVIDELTGEIFIADSSQFDFEKNEQINATAVLISGNTFANVIITIVITDVDESALFNTWTGPMMRFTKEDNANPADLLSQDRITNEVWITRGTEGGQIYNIKKEIEADMDASPIDTEWALGTTEEIQILDFKPFRDAVGIPKEVVGKELVLHLITDDIYINVVFVSWSEGKTGGFSYDRSTQD